MEQLFTFLNQGKSPYHVVSNLVKTLQDNGCILLKEDENWELEPQKSYCVVRGSTSVIAFQLPRNKITAYRMVAAHSDSPTFKIKPAPDIMVENKYHKLNVETYGGSIYSSWLDRPLSMAGRILIDAQDSVCEQLVDIERDLLMIPSLAIHMNRECNKGMGYNPQVELQPLLGNYKKEQSLVALLAEVGQVSQEQILDYDLFLYPRQEAIQVGYENEFIMSPRLDDLECVFSMQEGFLEGLKQQQDTICNMMIVFDNEEVGSSTKQGANSTFLEDTLNRIAEKLELSQEDKNKTLAKSFIISADNGHAFHPNYPEKSDPINRPYINEGIVIKYHGGQKYTTDGYSGAFMKKLCREANVPFQIYTNRADVVGGSTLGNVLTSHISIASADIGLAQLAMHSAVETAGVKDIEYMIQLLKVYYGGKK